MSGSRGNTQADLVLPNATIWTVDPNLPHEEAVVIRGDEIVVVGQDGQPACGCRCDAGQVPHTYTPLKKKRRPQQESES